MVLDSLLKLRKGHTVECYAAAVVRQLLTELLDLELCAVGGVGRAHIVDGSDMDAALCHHVACNGTVDTARKQKERLSAASHGKSACSLDVLGVNKGVLVAYLNSNSDLGVLYVHGQVRESVKELSAQLRTYLGRLHGESLVGALCVDLEGLCTAEHRIKVLIALCAYVLEILLAYAGTAQSCDTEYLAHSVHYLVKVDVLVKRSDVCSRLSAGHLKVTEGLQSALYVLDEHILEGLFVQPLQSHLTIFYKY